MMKNIVVIGAGKGIGLSICKAVYENNHLVAITRSESEELNTLGISYQHIQIGEDDLSSLNLPETIDALVYCPGSINLKPFNRLSESDFMNDFQQNVIGAVHIIQKALPALKKSGNASVVLFSTVAAKLGMPFHASIAASKGAVEGLCKSLAAEYAASNIRFNVIAPSLTDTKLAGALLSSDEKRDAAAKRHPLNKIGHPDHMAQLVKFLISDDAAFITGQVIGADGGLGSVRL
jgi:NAD(P)-dependent dehydrogenase (short-subunit alcohol dehydrogenase family)